jgi:8-oxo-dGTP pyrophosphatase MutT (NUDIX family)
MNDSPPSERLLSPANLMFPRGQVPSSYAGAISGGFPQTAEPYLALARVVRYNAVVGTFWLLATAQPSIHHRPVWHTGGHVSRRQPSHRDVAVAALLDESDRVLLVRTRKLPDRWQPPGGGVEQGDSSPVAALAREIDEELGLSISPDYFSFEFRTNYDFGSGSVYCFSARVERMPSLALNTSEIQEASWFPLSTAVHLPAYPATHALLEHLLNPSSMGLVTPHTHGA